MKLSATEKRIYALAQKWANTKARHKYITLSEWNRIYKVRKCGRALLKLFKER